VDDLPPPISHQFAFQAASPAPARVPAPGAVAAAAKWPIREADFLIRDFRFRSGERMPSLRIH